MLLLFMLLSRTTLHRDGGVTLYSLAFQPATNINLTWNPWYFYSILLPNDFSWETSNIYLIKNLIILKLG